MGSLNRKKFDPTLKSTEGKRTLTTDFLHLQLIEQPTLGCRETGLLNKYSLSPLVRNTPHYEHLGISLFRLLFRFPSVILIPPSFTR